MDFYTISVVIVLCVSSMLAAFYSVREAKFSIAEDALALIDENFEHINQTSSEKFDVLRKQFIRQLEQNEADISELEDRIEQLKDALAQARYIGLQTALPDGKAFDTENAMKPTTASSISHLSAAARERRYIDKHKLDKPKAI